MSVSAVLHDQQLTFLPPRREMATLSIGRLDITGFAPGGTAAVSVNIIEISSVNTNLVFCFSGC